MLYRKEYECASCGLKFERVTEAEQEETRCPFCGSRVINLLKSEEKNPATTDEASRYTCN